MKVKICEEIIFFFNEGTFFKEGFTVFFLKTEASDVRFQVVNENTIRPLNKRFSVELKLTNILTSGELRDVSIRITHSDHVNITALKIEDQVDPIYGQFQKLHLISKKLVAAKVISFAVVLTLYSDYPSGYHVENLLFNIYWIHNGVHKSSGYQKTLLPYVIPGCETLFDVENGELREDQVSASTFYENSPPHTFGPNSQGWCANVQDNEQFLQILFTKRARIVSVTAGPRIEKKDAIKDFVVSYLMNGKWVRYEERGSSKLFTSSGEVISNLTRNWLLKPIETDGMRIQPINWKSPLICTRLAIIGCYISKIDNCINPIGMESGAIPKGALTDNNDDSYSADKGRLNHAVTTYPYGWSGEWLQISLSSLFKVTRIGIQSGYDRKGVVTVFKMSISNDTFNWFPVKYPKTGGLEFDNRVSTEEISKHVSITNLPEPVVTRAVRIQVVAFSLLKTMRMELYGCPVLPQIATKSTHVTLYQRSALVDIMMGNVVMCQYNEDRPSCYGSEKKGNFRKWTGHASNIVQVLGTDFSNKTYALTKQNNYAVKLPESQIWRDISEKEWKSRTLRSKSVILPTVVSSLPIKDMQWEFLDNSRLSVTGNGLHYQITETYGWKNIASWSCCGF